MFWDEDPYYNEEMSERFGDFKGSIRCGSCGRVVPVEGETRG